MAIASPLTAIAIWWIHQQSIRRIEYNSPGAKDDRLRQTYILYMRDEGHAARGFLFLGCAMALAECTKPASPYCRPVGKDEVLYHLGPPDESVRNATGTDHIYNFVPANLRALRVVVSISNSNGQSILTSVTCQPISVPIVRSTTAPTSQPALSDPGAAR
ncbi:hypothetical protein BH09PLA1_BH09PLA1_31620 [soil metagenome]